MSRFERWSRRKLGQETDETNEEPPQQTRETGAHEDGDTLGDDPESEPAPGSLDHTLPDPDSLPAGADFSAYLAKGVSSQLRRRALRRLWSSGGYGVRDGLDDYDENYREVLKPLARDLADQLRRWTRPEPAPEEVELDPQEEAPRSPASEEGQAHAEPAKPQEAEPASPTDKQEAEEVSPIDQGSVGQEARTVKD